MNIRYDSIVSRSRFKKFQKERLYVPGRLFGLLYEDPQHYSNIDISAVVAKDDINYAGVCIYMDKYLFGWRGAADGIVGVYVKPEYRGRGVAGQLLKRMIDRNDKVMGHTYDLNRVADKLNTERLIELKC